MTVSAWSPRSRRSVVLLATAPSPPARRRRPSTPITSLTAFAFDVEGRQRRASASALGSSLTLASTGVFVAPANQDCAVTAALGKISLDQQLVVIGKKTCVDTGSGLAAGQGTATSTSPSSARRASSSGSGFAVKPPKGVTPTKEVENGIATLHYDAGSDVGVVRVQRVR